MGGGGFSGVFAKERKNRSIALLVQLKKGLQFLTANSLFVALNGSVVVVFSCFIYGITISMIPFDLLLGAFLITFSVYCLNNATDRNEDAVNSPEYKSKCNFYYFVPSIGAMLGGVVIGFLRGWSALFVLSVPLIIGVAYSIPIVKSIPRLKEIVGVKSLVVAASWAVTGALLPLTIQIVDFYMIMLAFFYIFVLIFINTVICDVVDIKGDFTAGVHTIPTVLGRRKSQILLLMVNGTLLLWLFAFFMSGSNITVMLALALGVFYEFFLVWHFLKPQVNRLHAEVAVDGAWIPIVICLAILVL